MKKLIISIVFFVMALGVYSQERIIEKTGRAGLRDGTYFKYDGVAADTLTSTNQDTIDLIVEYQGAGFIKKLSVKSRFDMITTADTTVAISVFGKEFDDDPDYVQIIASTLSGAVTANNTVKVLSSDYIETADTSGSGTIISLTPFDKSYRFYRIRYIIKGNDSVGTGIKLDEVEIKAYTN